VRAGWRSLGNPGGGSGSCSVVLSARGSMGSTAVSSGGRGGRAGATEGVLRPRRRSMAITGVVDPRDFASTARTGISALEQLNKLTDFYWPSSGSTISGRGRAVEYVRPGSNDPRVVSSSVQPPVRGAWSRSRTTRRMSCGRLFGASGRTTAKRVNPNGGSTFRLTFAGACPQGTAYPGAGFPRSGEATRTKRVTHMMGSG